MARVRAALSAAWSCHDYREVVRLLDPIVEHLTPSEIRKLAFSKKQLAT
jgi:hypothetical protein